MMNPEIKKRWVEELRSGKYVQGTRFLRQEGVGEDAFCCLGVLCDLYAKEKEVEWDIAKENVVSSLTSDFTNTTNKRTFMHCKDYVPAGVMLWAGLNERDPYVVFKGMDRTLSDINDDWQTFDTIASYIEEQL